MKTFKFSLMLRIRENTDVFITLDDNIYGIHSKRVNILYLSQKLRGVLNTCIFLSQSRTLVKEEYFVIILRKILKISP